MLVSLTLQGGETLNYHIVVIPFSPRARYGDINKVILTFESVDEILCVTIQMKHLQQYFHMVLFIF